LPLADIDTLFNSFRQLPLSLPLFIATPLATDALLSFRLAIECWLAPLIL
jgi:hypothetical protein